MNQTAGIPTYSFVQPGSNRINIAPGYKPTTADTRLVPSPYKTVKRDNLDSRLEFISKSPVKRNVSYSAISPVKQGSTVFHHRIPASKIESSCPVNLMPQSHKNSRRTEEKKNAIEQIINNCTQLNMGHPVRIHENNQNIRYNDLRMRDGDMLCVTGDNKKARYRREDDSSAIYCSKCSIVMLGKGIKLIDLESQKQVQSVENREQELKQFTNCVSTLKEDLSRHLESINRQKQAVIVRTKEQKSLIIKTYQQLYKSLKEFETKDVNQVLFYQQEFMKTLGTFEADFQQAIGRLELISQDINPNIQMIKTQIDEQQYRAFLNDYKNQVKDVKNKSQNFVKNVVDSVKPQVLHKDATKLTYDIISLVDYPIGFNKNSLYFSFQSKNMNKKEANSNKIKVQDLDETSATSAVTIPSLQTSQPFRTLFSLDDRIEGDSQRASPTFKKI